MTTSTSRLAYQDCYDLMDRALAEPQGVRARFSDKGAALYFRLRLHTAREINRRDNAQSYSEGHPLYGRSIYDELAVRIREEANTVWLRIEKFSLDNMHIEPIGDGHGLDLPTQGNRGEAEREVEEAEAATPAPQTGRRM